jgi:ABC-2 type transport system ATP-binding protein
MRTLTPHEIATELAYTYTGSTPSEELLAQAGSGSLGNPSSIAQSLINDPEIVFMDEPMSGLDPIGRREVRELIADLRHQGKTVFMSTHILSDVEALCDEVAILRKGKLAATGRLDELLESHAGNQVFEVNLRGVDVTALAPSLSSDMELEPTPSGVRVRFQQENSIDTVLAAARSAGGSLISVVPVKQSLEELFVSKTED